MKNYKTIGILVVLLLLMVIPMSGNDESTYDAWPNWFKDFGKCRTAIISVFGAELEVYKEQADISKTIVLNGRSVFIGNFNGHQIVMTLSGESIVNAAMTTQAILDRFRIKRIVFSGIAGGVNPNLHIGDVVVPVQWAEYQQNLAARETQPGVFRPPPWFQRILPNFGMMFPKTVSITTVNGPPDHVIKHLWFKADPGMMAIAEQVAEDVILDRCTPEGICLDELPIVKVGGNGVSGPTFVDNAEYREYAWNTWSADALDEESAAVAHVATVNDVPFIIFRSLSDLAGGGPG